MIDFSRKRIQDICNQNGITYLGVFGSFSRGEENPGSDIDLLVDFDSVKSLFELVHIENTFTNILGKPVDLVLKKNLKKRIEPYVLKDLKTLYEKR